MGVYGDNSDIRGYSFDESTQPTGSFAAQGQALGKQAAEAGKQRAFQAGQAGQDRAFQAGQGAADRALQGTIAGQSAAAQMYPASLQQGRFDKVFPWLQNQYGNAQNQMATVGGRTGGQVGNQPTINAGPIWNDQQIQQQVNNQRASTDQSTATNVRNAQTQLGGKGFGSSSPLMAELNAQFQGQGLQTKTGQEQQTRWGAAQGNAQQQLAGQQAQEGQFASRQQEAIARGSQDIERQKPYFAQQNALISALAGLV